MSRICWKCYGQKPPTIPHADSDCIEELRRRVEQIESKLGAATSGVVSDCAADCPGSHAIPGTEHPVSGESASVSTAAPSVSLYIRWGTEHQQDDILAADRLAAAVTEWLQRHELDDSRDGTSEQFLFDTVFAFVRGEPLPQKGG